MKKAGVIFLFIIGFIIVFLVSGLISYMSFSRGNKADDIKATENVNDIPKVNIPTQSDGMLTIVTPGLNENDTIVRYGTKNDIANNGVANKSAEGILSFGEETAQEEEAAETKTEEKPESKTEEKPESKPENKPESKPEAPAKKETEAKSENKTETKTEVKEEPKAENKQEAEKPAEVTEQPREENKVEKPKTELNPNVQTSDSGL